MFRSSPSTLLLLALLLYLSSATTLPFLSRSSRCPVIYNQDPPHTPRIVNGDSASVLLSPSLVALFRGSSHFVCTGTLISPHWVVTAAHCGLTSSDTAGLLLRNSLRSHPSNVDAVFLKIREEHHHPAYVDEEDEVSRQNDIAFLELETDAPAAAVPMRLNVNVSIPEAGSFVRVVGFGSKFHGDKDRARPLAQVDVPTVSSRECARRYVPVIDAGFSDSVHVCSGYLGRSGCGSCFGDSGGPLVQYTAGGEAVLVAVVSAGVKCADGQFPTINMRVASFRRFGDAVGATYSAASRTDPVFVEKAGLSTWAIVAIATGAAVLAVIVVAALVMCRPRKDDGVGMPAARAWETGETLQPDAGWGAPPPARIFGEARPAQAWGGGVSMAAHAVVGGEAMQGAAPGGGVVMQAPAPSGGEAIQAPAPVGDAVVQAAAADVRNAGTGGMVAQQVGQAGGAEVKSGEDGQVWTAPR